MKLKSSLVRILCGLATFDNVFLVLACFMFTLPALSARSVSKGQPTARPPDGRMREIPPASPTDEGDNRFSFTRCDQGW